MPYETNNARLLRLVRRALEDTELSARLDDIAGEKGFAREDLIGEVSNKFMTRADESVWLAASHHIDRIRDLDSELNKAQQMMPQPPVRSQPLLLVWLGRLLIFFGTLAVILIVAAVGFGLFIGWSTITSTLFGLSVVRSGAVTTGVLLAILISVYIAARIIPNRRYKRQRKEISPRISELRDQINAGKSEADNAVIESGIKLVLREIVAHYLEKSYELTLELRKALRAANELRWVILNACGTGHDPECPLAGLASSLSVVKNADHTYRFRPDRHRMLLHLFDKRMRRPRSANGNGTTYFFVDESGDSTFFDTQGNFIVAVYRGRRLAPGSGSFRAAVFECLPRDHGTPADGSL